MKNTLLRLTLQWLKLTILGIMLHCVIIPMLWAGNSTTQSIKSVKEVQVYLNLQNSTLSDIFRGIERQTNFSFSYNIEDLDGSIRISEKYKNAVVADILLDIARIANLKFKQVNNNIHVSRDKTVEKASQILEILIQSRNISGKVISKEDGSGLPGVNVVEMGTTNGTVTDAEGKYILEVAEGATLIFSSVGYVSEQVPIGNRSVIDMALLPDIKQLEELVVVGYGVQEKVNVLGSISTVKADELTVNPMPFIAQSLMGKAAGLNIKNVGGQPGDETAINFNIRGFGAPLIIIDGAPATESDFINLSPNEIDNLSVLKDAAAASVYGARAGNGVILVTTKRGTISAPKLTFNSNFELQYFLAVPEWVNSEERARMENVYRYNEGLSPNWTEDQIQKFHDGSDPDRYPYTDWWSKTVRKYAPQQHHNLNIQGGTEKIKYFVSGGYFYQEAMLIVDETKNKRYNLRSNLDISLTNKLNMNVDLAVVYKDYFGPIMQMERRSTSATNNHGIMTYLFRSRSYQNFMWPDPTKLPKVGDNNPWVLQQSKYVGYIKNKGVNGDAKLGFSYDLPLGIKATASYRFYNGFKFNKEVNRKTPLYYYNWDTDEYTLAGYTPPGDSKVYQYSSNTLNFDQQYFLNWGKKFDDHDISAMIGYEKLSDRNEWFDAYRMRYPYEIDYLFAGPTLDQSNNGRAGEGGRVGIISRITYDYKGKYLVEVNSRNDASPRFPKETRWGFFPSAALGWRISEEPFMKDNLTFFNDLKLRASYGKLGYDQTGNFQFLETYSLNGRVIRDGSTNTVLDGIKADALPNPSITWEKMTTKNVGLDFNFNIGRLLLEGSFDYFYRLRSDVLGARLQSIPNVVGASMPQVNYAKYDNRGWEFILNHRNNVSKIKYMIGGNIAWNREKTVYVDQDQFSSEEAYRRGNKIGEWTDNFWGLMTDGLFQSEEEIKGWADIDGKNNATILPGDVKFVDYNGDNVINDDDQVIIGRGTFPKLMYGINMSAEWKGFNFAMLWQGAGLYDFYLKNAPDLSQPFWAGDTPTKTMLEEYYVPEGQPWLPPNTTNAKYPRYRGDIANRSTPSFQKRSQIWLIDGSYIRLKSLELGYTIPRQLTSKLSIDACKLYLSGYNLLTFSQLDFMDPEIDTSPRATFGDYYPPVGTYNLGILVQF